ASAIDPSRGLMFVSAGTSLNQGRLDLWALDIRTLRWSELEPTGELPGWCSGHSAVWDPSRNALIVLGSQCPDTRASIGAWMLDPIANRWQRLEALTPPTSDLVYGAALRDPARDRILVMGGVTGNSGGEPWALGFNGTEGLRI